MIQGRKKYILDIYIIGMKYIQQIQQGIVYIASQNKLNITLILL